MLESRGHKVSNVTLTGSGSSTGSGSGPNWARVVLTDITADFWDEWKLTAGRHDYTIRGHKVTLTPSLTDHLLCVARLPRDLSEHEFQQLVSAFGEIRRSFLLYSEKTGKIQLSSAAPLLRSSAPPLDGGRWVRVSTAPP